MSKHLSDRLSPSFTPILLGKFLKKPPKKIKNRIPKMGSPEDDLVALLKKKKSRGA